MPVPTHELLAKLLCVHFSLSRERALWCVRREGIWRACRLFAMRQIKHGYPVAPPARVAATLFFIPTHWSAGQYFSLGVAQKS